MMPVHGDKKQPRINVTMGDTMFKWLFDMGAAITCMNANSFHQAFKDNKPGLIQKETDVLWQTDQKWTL